MLVPTHYVGYGMEAIAPFLPKECKSLGLVFSGVRGWGKLQLWHSFLTLKVPAYFHACAKICFIEKHFLLKGGYYQSFLWCILCSLGVLWWGGGAWSLYRSRKHKERWALNQRKILSPQFKETVPLAVWMSFHAPFLLVCGWERVLLSTYLEH